MLSDLERARSFAASIAAYRYPHSGAIETYGAEHVEGSTPETWRVGSMLVSFDAEGVYLNGEQEARDV